MRLELIELEELEEEEEEDFFVLRELFDPCPPLLLEDLEIPDVPE